MWFDIEGPGVENLKHENGGHRIQRVPPTERNGRVHTSTVTVAVIDPEFDSVQFDPKDVRIVYFSGTGNGGQARNKVQKCVRATHIPTGLTETRQGRDRLSNVNQAIDALRARVTSNSHNSQASSKMQTRKELMGSGERGDKIRTYRFQEGLVKDHNTNKTAKINKILNGQFDLLW